MTLYDFEIGGRINAETLDDAIDILQITMDDNRVVLKKFVVAGKDGVISICKTKT